jgi:hypothetical protein
MNSYREYNTVHAAVDLATSAMNERLQADRDVAKYCDGMAFDGASATEVYRNALDHCGVSRNETAGLSASALKAILKNLPRSGSGGAVTSYSASLAMDASSGNSTLDAILKGIPAPRNLTGRGEI